MSLIYLLTGGAGFLGGNIVSLLAARGDHIRVLALPGDVYIKNLPAGVEIVEGNILNEADLDRLFKLDIEQEAIVIHAAAIITMSLSMDENVRKVNVQGTHNVVNRCYSKQIKKTCRKNKEVIIWKTIRSTLSNHIFGENISASVRKPIIQVTF